MNDTPGILLVGAEKKNIDALRLSVPPGLFASVATALGAGEARRAVLSLACEVVVIDGPLADDPGMALAADLAAGDCTEVLLLLRPEQFNLLAGPAAEQGILVLPKPLEPLLAQQVFPLLAATGRKLLRLRGKTESLQEKMAEIRLVNRAKLLLVEHEHLSEGEAHRRIEKLAMDLGLKRRQVAQRLIYKYEG